VSECEREREQGGKERVGGGEEEAYQHCDPVPQDSIRCLLKPSIFSFGETRDLALKVRFVTYKSDIPGKHFNRRSERINKIKSRKMKHVLRHVLRAV